MTINPLNILITGGAGFIGSNFVRFFYHTHPRTQIVNLDLLSYAGNPDNLRDIEQHELHLENGRRRYTFVQGDICNESLVDGLFSQYKFDTVFHFAAESHVDRSIFNVLHFVRTNIEGTRSLVEAARKYGTPRFIHVSTDEVYGSIAKGYADEQAPLVPSNPYSASKAGGDLLIQSYIKTHGFPAVIVRGSNNYGPYQYPEKLIPLAITNMLEEKKVPIHGDGMQVRSWLYVNDFCRAVDLIARQAAAGQIYNVAGEEKNNLDVLRILAGHLSKNFESFRHHVKDRPAADMRYAVDGSKLVRELGWKRTHHFEESIGEVVRWYREHDDWWRTIRLKKGFQEHYERQAKGEWC